MADRHSATVPSYRTVDAVGADAGMNALRNASLSSTHSPSPSLTSVVNTKAGHAGPSHLKHRERRIGASDASQAYRLQAPSNWPSDVVYITQNLVAASVPDSLAQRYVLRPSTTALSGDAPSVELNSTSTLPKATHNAGRPQTLYVTSIQHQVPLVILPIDRTTPWCPDSFHSTSRQLSCHPAAGSHGLFAAQDFEADTFLRPYLGVLHTKQDADFYSTYDLSLCHDPRLLDDKSTPAAGEPGADPSISLNDAVQNLQLDDSAANSSEEANPTALYLDSRYWGNESRFVNDYRGIAQKPNVEFRSFIQLSPSEGGTEEHREVFQMGLFATRPIRKGHELVVNYGKSYWLHHEQLEQQEAGLAATRSAKQSPVPPSSRSVEPKIDPIQAMLHRSRMRVSRTAVHPQRPPQPPSPNP